MNFIFKDVWNATKEGKVYILKKLIFLNENINETTREKNATALILVFLSFFFF